MSERYLNPTQRQFYEDRIRQYEGMKREIESGGMDERGRVLGISAISGRGTEGIDMEIARCKKILKDKTAPSCRGKSKDKAWKEIKELLTEIKAGMPTYDEMWETKDGHKLTENAHKHIAWEQRNIEKIKKVRNLLRRLEADNPIVGNTEFWRRNNADEIFKRIMRN